jgi:predicted DCC family thiol-disulfide oxidoreductase YuxK
VSAEQHFAPAEGIPDGTVLLDGTCVLCARSFRFVARRDPGSRFRFTALQSEYGRWMADRLGIDPKNPLSFAVVIDGRAVLKSDGVIAILRRLRGWSWCGIFLAVPRPFRDWVYDRVARNRYRMFGKLDFCALPDPATANHLAPLSPPKAS